MAPHAETAGQVQGVHGLGLKLPKHGPAHGLQLLVELLAELGEDQGDLYWDAGLGWYQLGALFWRTPRSQRPWLCATLLH